ncbi:uncharacterized protein L969DRAFT_85339 [Mixia osmundae IAM 14324]|uniref:Protein kinase domain-containing protein n=1 Tax=Mixia osmundae (strain CBS 9802 / IAM 14324 / JCM 22182 / KY 12970) TaxID=764103 RepID=G7DYI4_MIXOS|nr:uncharacterized protein L969DRAFT_85339 [Mixia osmundae IAM 14324]KEI41545.1 hypothetical protein L969DRAFT_85339 [Mixia osmundae IAM 14324]GAA95644.1 hypothetical protein E5Q_02300 [Mixia osmundae IAM 14324]
MAPSTVPCQYKTGQVLGQGTYAVVKQAVHIETGKMYAVKVINKRLMSGREHMVRNEINVLKKISEGHPNILTLRDYFETANNLYLVTDLCTGGELFDRICAKGSYYERDAAHLIKIICQATSYLHHQGIVHRDLKPENLLFRSKEEDSDLLIADFGLSRVIDDSQFTVLTTTCGTPGYMAPEIFRKEGHTKPVDIWAIGVISYFLLAGYTPFDRDSQPEEISAICKADYTFEPKEYWHGVSQTARDFISSCLTVDQSKRPTADQCLEHPWLQADKDDSQERDLLPNLRRQFDAKKTLRKAMWSVRFTTGGRMRKDDSHLSPEEKELKKQVLLGKHDAENEDVQNVLAVSRTA